MALLILFKGKHVLVGLHVNECLVEQQGTRLANHYHTPRSTFSTFNEDKKGNQNQEKNIVL